MISTKELQKDFIDWMRDCHDLTEGQVIAVDGKTVRGSYDKSRGQSAIHMVNVFVTANCVCLAQSKVNKKTNEITDIPKLLEILEILDIAGCLITIDVMGCQKKIAQKIINKSADYLLAVKGNQGKLHRAFKDCYDPKMLQSFDEDSHLSHDKSHARLETRCALINKDLSVLGDLEFDWPALKTMGIMVNIRQENEHATESFSKIRPVCLILLKKEKECKGGITRNKMKCAMEQAT